MLGAVSTSTTYLRVLSWCQLTCWAWWLRTFHIDHDLPPSYADNHTILHSICGRPARPLQ